MGEKEEEEEAGRVGRAAKPPWHPRTADQHGSQLPCDATAARTSGATCAARASGGFPLEEAHAPTTPNRRRCISPPTTPWVCACAVSPQALSPKEGVLVLQSRWARSMRAL